MPYGSSWKGGDQLWREEKLNTYRGIWNADITSGKLPYDSNISNVYICGNQPYPHYPHYTKTMQKPCKKQYSHGLMVSPFNQAQGAEMIRNFTKKIEKLVQLHEECAVVHSWHAVMSPLKLDCFKGTTWLQPVKNIYSHKRTPKPTQTLKQRTEQTKNMCRFSVQILPKNQAHS